jgi:hypothetical protein
MFEKLEIDKLWIAFGKGKHLRWIPVPLHEISNALGPRDTVSVFRGKGKRTAWQAWETFDETTDMFICMSKTPAAIGDQDIKCIEAFCSHHVRQGYVNKARFEMFSRK